MAELMLKAIKPVIAEMFDKLQAGAPAAITSLLSTMSTWLTGSVEQVSAYLTRLYSTVSTQVAAWLPTTAPVLTARAGDLIGWAKAKVDKL